MYIYCKYSKLSNWMFWMFYPFGCSGCFIHKSILYIEFILVTIVTIKNTEKFVIMKKLFTFVKILIFIGKMWRIPRDFAEATQTACLPSCLLPPGAGYSRFAGNMKQ